MEEYKSLGPVMKQMRSGDGCCVIHPMLAMFDIVLHVISVGNLQASDIITLGTVCKTINKMIFSDRMKNIMFKRFPQRFGMLGSKWQIPFIKSLLRQKAIEYMAEGKLCDLATFAARGPDLSKRELVLYGITNKTHESNDVIDNVAVVTFTIPNSYALSLTYMAEESEIIESMLENVYLTISRGFTVHLNHKDIYYLVFLDSNERVTSYFHNGATYKRERTTLDDQLKLNLASHTILGTDIQQSGFKIEDYKDVTNGISIDPNDTTSVKLDKNDKIVYTTKIDRTITHPIYMEIISHDIAKDYMSKPPGYEMRICKQGLSVLDETYVHHPYFRSLQLNKK